MSNLLFNDSETFTKERPIKLSEKQENEIWRRNAQDIYDNGWSSNNIDTIITDLKTLSLSDSGYEMAKELEGFRVNGCYKINTPFIEWLEDLNYSFSNVIRKNVKRWVKAHDIKPKYEIGNKLIVTEHFTRSQELEIGKVIFVNGHYRDVAKYLVSNTPDSNRNIIITYENIEKFTSKL